jgi:hypothetical protein
MPSREDLEAVAHLVGATNAQMKQMDEQIVSTSTNLQTSSDSWDPKTVINNAAKELNLISGQTAPQSAPQPAPQHVPATEPMIQPTPPPVQGYAQPLPTMSPDAVAVLLRIEQKLDLYMEKINRLERIGDAINKGIERGLKSRLKQVTIKLDDSINIK